MSAKSLIKKTSYYMHLDLFLKHIEAVSHFDHVPSKHLGKITLQELSTHALIDLAKVNLDVNVQF